MAHIVLSNVVASISELKKIRWVPWLLGRAVCSNSQPKRAGVLLRAGKRVRGNDDASGRSGTDCALQGKGKRPHHQGFN